MIKTTTVTSLKNIILLYTAILVVLLSTVGLVAGDPQPGAVFATDSSGDHINLFPGTQIHINGHHHANNSSITWDIYDMEKPSGSPIPGVGDGTLLHSGNGETDSTGHIPNLDSGWRIPIDDHEGHQYKLLVTVGPNDEPYADFYTKVDSFEPVPELSTIVLFSTGIIGLLGFLRLRKKD